jgi:hypothetical protein
VEHALDDNDRTAALVAAAGTEAARQIVAPSNAAKTSIGAIAVANALEFAAQTTFDGSLASYRNSVESISEITTAEIGLLHARDAAGGT